MATFISTVQFTEQGKKEISATCARAEKFVAAAADMGVEIQHVYWTFGEWDGVLIFAAPDEETAAAAMLHLGSFGNVRTQTAHAYNAAEMEQILAKLR